MPAVADLVLAELPEEFSGPVGYADRWLWIAAALAGALILYYLLAWWFTRPPRPPALERTDLPDVRRQHLTRIDRIDERVRTGDLAARDGHQQLSEVVRDYVATVTTLPARTMALADFRDRAPAVLVEVLELVYPPEFAPDEGVARDRFDAAVAQARGLVGSWSVPGSPG
ncbi:hypothetical protein KVF89_18090 [Nocardioides carbamazepini]|uniref:hypothetical protein n=1 Tax=Nocardioides carbamazepini TaxID=2854259 RepID=UPI00214A5B0C|nr:hypothetical protein [Nocardioides carbamazepini]MCR1784459.1 hypothetical protein [Nocardioides carbamazepini]